jgi:hypothetical protein
MALGFMVPRIQMDSTDLIDSILRFQSDGGTIDIITILLLIELVTSSGVTGC